MTSFRSVVVFVGTAIMLPSCAWGKGPEERTGRALEGHSGDVHCVAFAPDGKTLASGGEDGTIRVWDVDKGKELYRFTEDKPASVVDLDYAPDGKTVIACIRAPQGARMNDYFGAVRFWDVETRKVRQTIKFPVRTQMALSPDGKTLATFAGGRLGIYDIYLWDGATGKEVGTLDGGDVMPTSFAFSADSKTLAVGLMDGTVQLWDFHAKKVLASWQVKRLNEPDVPSAGERITAMAFAPDGRSLMTSDVATGRLYLSDVANAKVCDQFNVACGGWRCLTYSPKGGFLAAGAPVLLETSRCVPQYRLVGAKHGYEYLVYSPDGKWIAAACGKDKFVMLWQAPEE